MENGRLNTLLWLGLGTKEQQILSQALRHALIATRQRCVLKQDARRSPLGVNIHRQQRLGQGLEKRCCELPEHRWLARGFALGQPQADETDFRRGVDIAVLHDLQHALIETTAHFWRVAQRLGCGRCSWVHPAPRNHPQVGRVDAIRAGHLLHLPELRKQAHGRAWPLAELRLQVLDQCEPGTLQRVCRLLSAFFGMQHELLNRALHAANHLCRHRLAHHVQRAHHLVQLLARHAQLAGVHRRQINTAGRLCVVRETLEGFGGRFDRLARFVQNPRQWPQVCHGGCALGADLGLVVHHHDFMHSRSDLRQSDADAISGARLFQRGQAILNRATDWRNSSAMRASSRTWLAVERVLSPVCSVTAKMCWMLLATSLA